jgi:hypothetical protein
MSRTDDRRRGASALGDECRRSAIVAITRPDEREERAHHLPARPAIATSDGGRSPSSTRTLAQACAATGECS